MPTINPPPRGPMLDPHHLDNPTRVWEKWFMRLYDLLPRTQTVTFDPASVPANSTSEQTITVPGATTNDIVFVSKPSYTAGLGIVNARVSADDTVAVTFMNNSGGAIDAGSEDYQIFLMRL